MTQVFMPTKIHALSDDEGRPRVFALTPGNVADISLAPRLIAAAGPLRRLTADKACGANSPLRQLALDFLATHALAAIVTWWLN